MSNINLNKYADRAAYNADTRPAGENCVSLVGQEVIYNGVNVILKKEQLRRDDVCPVFWDNTDNCYVFIPIETYNASKLDTIRYQTQNYVRFTRSMGRDVVIHKERKAGIWSEYNRYKLQCDTSASGGFSWSVKINGVDITGTVSWSAGANLDSIVTQLNSGVVSDYLVFSHESGEDFIRIRKGGFSNSLFTITNARGATLEDLSIYTKVNGVQQEQVHRDWQTTPVSTLFPNSGFPAPNGRFYAKNGFDVSTNGGIDLSKFKSFYEINGSDVYMPEDKTKRWMKRSTFDALNNSGIAAQQALYNKYNGSWDAYIEAGMIKIDDEHPDGLEYENYDNGDVLSQFLASVTTMDFDGTYIPAYPAAYTVAQCTDTRGVITKWNLPTVHEIVVFHVDDMMRKINIALNELNAVEFKPTNSWGVTQTSITQTVSPSITNGVLIGRYAYMVLYCYPIAYLD